MLRQAFLGMALCFAANILFADTPAPIPVQAFFSYSKFSTVKISPDGKYLAIAVSDDDTGEDRKFLAIVGTVDRKIDSGFKVADQHEILDFWWANNERVLIATATNTGALSAPTADGALYAINVDKTHPSQLLGDKPNKRLFDEKYYFNSMLFIPPVDAHHILVRGSDDKNEHPLVLDVDIYTGDVSTKVISPTWYGGFQTDSDGNVRIAWGENKKTGASEFYYRDKTANAEWKNFSVLYANDDHADVISGPAGITQDGKSFYWYGRTSNGVLGLFRVNPPDLNLQTLYADPEYDVETMIYGDFEGNQDKIIAVETVPGLPMFHIIDQNDHEATILQELTKAFPGYDTHITSSTRDGSLLIVLVESDRDPGDYYLFNTKAMKADYLFSRLDGIDPDSMASMRPIEFNARDGLLLHGYLTLPLGEKTKNLPLILLPHGGPHGIRDTWGWDPEVQYFAYNGFAVLQVNYRGSGGYGIKFQDIGYRHWGTTMLDDLADAVRWAEQQGIANPQRVCIYGASYGGYAAIESVIRYPDLYKCAIGYVGVYDLTIQEKYSDTEKYASGRHYFKSVLGDDTAELEKYSPVYNADKIDTPVFIIYGGKDQRVVPDNAKELLEAMDKAGKKYAPPLFEPYEGHGFKKPEHRFNLYTSMLKFFNEYIGPGASRNIDKQAAAHQFP